jgi:SAM-dependent methyltransferase
MDTAKVEQLATRLMADLGATALTGLLYIGDKVGLFKAMVGAGPLTVAEVAAKSGLQARYVREWLSAMAAGQYIDYDPHTERFTLPDEHAAVLADETSLTFMGGFFQVMVPVLSQAPQVAKAFREGGGVPYSAYGSDLIEGISRNRRVPYFRQLAQEWIPAMPEVLTRLQEGGTAADIGCGCGYAVIAMAKAFPHSRFYGYDLNQESLAIAREHAAAEGAADRTVFAYVSANALPAEPRFDFITSFDSIHDMADPRGALRSIRQALAPGGTYMMMEIAAGDTLADNLNMRGRFFYSVSTLHCLTVSLAHNGEGIGTVMGEAKARELAAEAGFTHFRRLPIDHKINVFYEMKVA